MEAKVKRALVFGSVPCRDWSFLEAYRREDQQVYCADGGLNNALAAGCKPDFVVGDWDSGGAPRADVPSVTLPVEKDMTDLQAALHHALAAGCTEFLLCGCLGGRRLDHTAFNLVLLEWLKARGGQGILIDEDNEVRLLEHETVTLHPEEGPRYRYLSLLPLDRTVEGVSIEGVKYPLTDAAILRGDTLTVSNQPAGPVVSVTVGDGRALLIRSERDA